MSRLGQGAHDVGCRGGISDSENDVQLCQKENPENNGEIRRRGEGSPVAQGLGMGALPAAARAQLPVRDPHEKDRRKKKEDAG